jgi:hypothetical protein
MAERAQTPFGGESGNKARRNSCKMERESSAVYVRYKDHVLFKNVQKPKQPPTKNSKNTS